MKDKVPLHAADDMKVSYYKGQLFICSLFGEH